VLGRLRGLSIVVMLVFISTRAQINLLIASCFAAVAAEATCRGRFSRLYRYDWPEGSVPRLIETAVGWVGALPVEVTTGAAILAPE
jgi:hypothetical protein